MKLEFINRGAATRLILIFSGWSTTPEFYRNLTFDGWDTAVVTDYSDSTMPHIPDVYKTIYLIAYSLGVWAADRADIRATARIAVAGTGAPVSDVYGIPEAIYTGTENNLDLRNLKKFHRRMAGDKETFTSISGMLPSEPDIEGLRKELRYIRECQTSEYPATHQKWDRVYIPVKDGIIPYENQIRWWREYTDTDIVTLPEAHAVYLKKIIRSLIPDHTAIGAGFRKSLPSYRENAKVQTKAAYRMGEFLKEHIQTNKVNTLLEIGSGPGLLTEVWRKLVRPSHATYIDLYESDVFEAADDERYVTADAEEWLERTDEKYDVILSASAIQWFSDPIRFIKELRHHLNPGGIAVISTFLKGNLGELDNLRPSPILYRTEAEYKAVSDIVESWTETLSFSSAREALLHLKLTGVSGTGENKSGLGKLLRTLADGKLTYRPAIIIVRND